MTNEQIEALIRLHLGQERQGPGDPDLARQILDKLPTAYNLNRIADMGCGAGAGALLLAERFGKAVKAVDRCRPFLDELLSRARDRGLDPTLLILLKPIWSTWVGLRLRWISFGQRGLRAI